MSVTDITNAMASATVSDDRYMSVVDTEVALLKGVKGVKLLEVLTTDESEKIRTKLYVEQYEAGEKYAATDYNIEHVTQGLHNAFRVMLDKNEDNDTLKNCKAAEVRNVFAELGEEFFFGASARDAEDILEKFLRAYYDNWTNIMVSADEDFVEGTKMEVKVEGAVIAWRHHNKDNYTTDDEDNESNESA